MIPRTLLALPTFSAALLLGQPALGQQAEIRLTRVVGGIANPVDIQSPRDGSGRLFVVEQRGIIRLFQNGSLLSRPVLDISSRTRGSGECGLLGLAFPPDFAARPYFYVNYTDPSCRNTHVARYGMTGDATQAGADSEQILLTVPQPFTNHNGGQLQFGPDGYLYIGLGDGGSARDPQNNGQTRQTLLGKMLRIDVSRIAADYTIPPTNPFAGSSETRPEIWALGLRNPWRFSFDRETGDLWIADVGQNRAEEVNFQPAASAGGENYGWRVMEGLQCLTAGCTPDPNFVAPVHEYTRAQGDVSITGGYVYRGPGVSTLHGTYVYGDYASGRIWGLRPEGRGFANRLLLDAPFSISTFGEDGEGRLYVADHGGVIYQVEPTQVSDAARPVISAVVDGASFEAGISPGSAATVFGSGFSGAANAASMVPLPLTLGGARVLVNGDPAPLYAVVSGPSGDQANFQVPWNTAGPTAEIVLERNGAASPPSTVAVVAEKPGVFSANNLAIAVHGATNMLVTAANPAAPGEAVYFYATGLGAVTNTPATGAGGPSSPLSRVVQGVTVSVGGASAEVLFSGLAPGLVGVYQVNIRIPDSAPAGEAPLVVSAGGRGSSPLPVSLRR